VLSLGVRDFGVGVGGCCVRRVVVAGPQDVAIDLSMGGIDDCGGGVYFSEAFADFGDF